MAGLSVSVSAAAAAVVAVTTTAAHGEAAFNPQEKELADRFKRLYPAVDERETPLPRCWSPKDKYSYIGLSQNNLRVHYKGEPGG